MMRRRGMSLLVCLFVMAFTSILLVGILGSETVRLSAVRNTEESDRAKFLAGAAVHHVMAEIEKDNKWATTPGQIANTEFPSGSGDFYNATVTPVTGQNLTYVITGSGITPEVTRVLKVTIKLGT